MTNETVTGGRMTKGGSIRQVIVSLKEETESLLATARTLDATVFGISTVKGEGPKDTAQPVAPAFFVQLEEDIRVCLQRVRETRDMLQEMQEDS